MNAKDCKAIINFSIEFVNKTLPDSEPRDRAALFVAYFTDALTCYDPALGQKMDSILNPPSTATAE